MVVVEVVEVDVLEVVVVDALVEVLDVGLLDVLVEVLEVVVAELDVVVRAADSMKKGKIVLSVEDGHFIGFELSKYELTERDLPILEQLVAIPLALELAPS